jgi:methyltransferase family protein
VQQLTRRTWRKLKSVLQPLPPRAQNAYATHIPILIGVAALRPIRRVLEFGCGHYSTKTFLKRAAFPDLKELQSVENDPNWAETMREAVKDDSRCVITTLKGAMCNAVRTFDLESFDLILVDDSTNAEQRATTIRALSGVHPSNPWLVIHDYEVEEYRCASAEFKERFTFKAYNPHTGLTSNSGFTSAIKILDRQLKNNHSSLAPDDADGWLRILRT